MFRSSSRIGVRGNKVVSHVEVQRQRRLVGESASRPVTSSFALAGMGGSNSLSMSVAGGGTGKQLDLMLTGLLPSEDEAVLRRIYLDMYYYDSVCGSCVDLMSNMPFSDFDLIGLEEKELRVYQKAIEKLTIRNMLPEISLDYLVNGIYTASLVFDNRLKEFTDSIPYQPWQVQVVGTPLYSRDPLIKISPDSEMKEFFSEDSPYFRKIQEQLPKKLLEAFQSKEFVPDPTTTIYLPRRTFPHQFRGISFLKRALPIYLLEKTLFRGTLVEAGRRMRSILHIQAGDETWEPTSAELSAISQMFQQADFDPLGAVVTTRNAIQPTEIRQGGDFWKITDIIGDTTSIKLRALGTSESFLSSDANFATAEVGLNTFLESNMAYRDMVTQKLFYNKLFPVIAVSNRLYKDDAQGRIIERQFKDMGLAANDRDNLKIPAVRWHKALRASNDRDTFDMLQALSEHNVPVPIRMWIAAGGVSYNDLVEGLRQNVDDLKELKELAAKASPGQQGGEGEDGESREGFEARLTAALRSYKPFRPTLVQSIMDRDFGEESEPVKYSVTGKKHHDFRPRQTHTRTNENIAKAARNLSDPEYMRSLSRKYDSKMVRRLAGYTGE